MHLFFLKEVGPPGVGRKRESLVEDDLVENRLYGVNADGVTAPCRLGPTE
jgi:hypothetical protein